MATLTFYSDATPETDTVDGFITSYVSSPNPKVSWAELLAGSETLGANEDSIYLTPAFMDTSTDVTNKWNRIRRAILTFKTSPIPDSATIVSATLSLYGYSTHKYDTLSAEPDINIYSAIPASDNHLIGADWSTLGTVAYCDTLITYANWSSGWNNFVLNTTGLAAISKTGITRIGARNVNYDVDGTAPPWSAYHSAYLACDSADGANPPKLVITYTTGGGGVGGGPGSLPPSGGGLLIEEEPCSAPLPEIPMTNIEAIVYRWLTQRKIAFEFQTSLRGGFYQLGGAVVDFILPSRSLAWRILGEYWHRGVQKEGSDTIQREMLTELGWIVVDLWSDDIENRLEGTLRLALMGQEVLH